MTQPNPEMRKKVAKACGWDIKASNFDEWWNPSLWVKQKDALTRKIAELIEAKCKPPVSGKKFHERAIYRARLSIALSTGSTNDLEALLVELLEA
jgi:hypothetical protein